MKKPSFSVALAQNSPPEAVAELATTQTAKSKDDRINTTLRISPEGLEAA